MPRVPTAEPQVRVRAPNVSRPVATPAPPQEAFGVGVQRAKQDLGGAIENTGTMLGKHLIDLEERNSQRIANENLNKFSDELKGFLDNTELDDQGRPKGFLQRKLSHANNSSVEFDQAANDLYQQYQDLPVSPQLRNSMAESLKSSLGAARERVIRHESSERQSAEKVALETFIAKSTEMAVIAPDPIDLSNVISAAKGNVAQTLSKGGHTPESIEVSGKALAGDMTKASVESLLETNPLKAKEILEAMQKKHGPLPNYPDLAKSIDGKIMFEQQNAIWNKVSTFRRSDGTIDSGRAQQFVMGLNTTAEKKSKFLSHVNSMAAVADSNLRENIKANDRSYANELVDLHAKGASFEEALALSTQRGRDLDDITEKQKQAKDLFTGKESAFDSWIRSMPQEYQAAGEYAEQVFKATYPRKNDRVKVKGAPEKLQGADAAIQEFKLQAIGKSPSQMRQMANEMVKEVVIKPRDFWFDETDISWKVSAENRLSIAQAMAKLENDFGVDRVARAKTRLRKEGLDVNPFNISKVLEKTRAGESQ